MTVIAMSRTEIDRMSVLQDLAASRITVADAATLMGLGRRQVFRLGKAFARHGPEALVSRRRGPAEQPQLSERLARRSPWHHPGALPGLRPNAGGREAGGAARHSPWARDAAAMDDRGRAVEGPPSAI